VSVRQRLRFTIKDAGRAFGFSCKGRARAAQLQQERANSSAGKRQRYKLGLAKGKGWGCEAEGQFSAKWVDFKRSPNGVSRWCQTYLLPKTDKR